MLALILFINCSFLISMLLNPSPRIQGFLVPTFEPNVVDHAETLSPEEKQSLNLAIQELRTKADVYAAIYLFKNLDGETIESAAEKTFSKWQLGEKDKNNGILLIFAINDRKARIETGYGLEGSITDIQAKQILNNIILPNFKSKEYAKGLLSGLNSIESFVSKKFDSPIPSIKPDEESNLNSKKGYHLWLVWAMIVLIIPFLDRFLNLLNGNAPRDKTATMGKKIFYLLFSSEFKFNLVVTCFLLVNPGIFIFCLPIIGIPQEYTSQFLEVFKIWTLFLLFVPPVLSTLAYFMGKGRNDKNPVFQKKGLGLFLFFINLHEPQPLLRNLLHFVLLPAITLLFRYVPSLLFNVENFSAPWIPMFHNIACYLLVLNYKRLHPTWSKTAYLRILAKERLYKIKYRVYGTRTIFGKKFTYTRSSHASSSRSSSSGGGSSSSGGGRSGGGGASSSW